MKKQVVLFIGVIAFVALFYHQDLGLNLSLFCCGVWGLLYYKTNRTGGTFWLLSAGVGLSALAFAWYGDAFSFWALVLSVLATGLYGQYPRINTLLYPGLFFFNFATFIFRVFLFKKWLPAGPQDKSSWWKKAIAFVVIPAVFFILFMAVYATGSDTFAAFFQQFAFLLDVWQIVVLGLVGFFFMFNYWFLWIPRFALKINQQLGDDFKPDTGRTLHPTFHFLELPLERRSGEISLVLLNALLLFFILLYNYEQFFQLQSGTTLSQEIHQRVATVIFSIFMAIGVILFYFKAAFNFDKKAGVLRKLAIAWMVLNALLIVSAFIKNGEYILNYGLTFRRIGVFIFLTLSLAGLWITYNKIKKRKTNSYLLRQMARLFFATFIVCSTLNFSWIVTKYNLVFHKGEDPAYLRSLEYNEQLLYDTYKSDPDWDAYFSAEKQRIHSRKQRSFLSSSLYYSFLRY